MQRLRGHQQDSSKLWPKAGHDFASENSDLGRLCAKAGRLFDLPTEAQWEYACRGGTVTAYNTGTNGDANGVIPDEELDKIAVYLSNSEIEIDGQVTNAFREVGTKLSNAFGLYDTVGNVAEYCLDSRLNADLGAFDPRDNDLVDPVGGIMPPVAADARLVLRGSWYKCKNSQYNHEGLYGGDVNAHRSAYRGYGSSYFTHEPTDFAGFRIVSPVGRAWPEMNDDVMEESACQNPGLRTVKFKYNLDDNAIVTMKVRVDGKDFSGLSADVAGDINRMVDAGNGKTKIISWNPDSTTEALESAADKVSVSLEKWSIENPPAYMAIELTDPSLTNIEYFAEGGVPGGATNVRYKTDWLLMRRIPAKNVVWWMGIATNSSGNSVEAVADDTKCAKRHLVKLDEDYFMSVFPMTERQWHWIAGTAPTNIATFTLPMLVDYNTVRPHRSITYLWPKDGHSVYPECVLGRLRTRSGGYRFDLPTEAQWEYACRALTGSAYCDGNVSLSAANGNSAANLEPYGWHLGNSSGQIHHVGEKLSNGFGLYDMHGNVWEWVLDFYDVNYGLTGDEIFAAQTVPVENPQGKSGLAWNDSRALRGGSYAHDANRARSGSRGEGGYCAYIRDPGSTVRLVCPIVPMAE
jgi:formylglycine-generating enzyme required for sulfatase activity